LTVDFELEDDGVGPRLAGEGEAVPPPELGTTTPADAPPDPLLVGEWSPQEAAQFAASLFSTGMLLAYVVNRQQLPQLEEWGPLVAGPHEFPGTGQALTPLLNRFLPKSMGGGMAAAGFGLIAVAGEMGIAIARRAPLLKKPGPRPAAVAEAPPDAPQAAPSSSAGGDGVFRFGREDLEVIGGAPDPSLVGFGL
jgi:hypothetical protein